MPQHVTCDLCLADDAEQVLAKCGTWYVRCRICGFIYTNPRITDPEKSNDNYFDQARDSYIESHFSPKKQKYFARIIRHLSRYRGRGNLLELGSSVGGLLYRAREMGWDPVGIEPVKACAHYAMETYHLNSIPHILEEAGLKSNYFDAIVSDAVFEHLPSPSRVLQEAFRVLRPGGVIYTITVNYDCYTRELLGLNWKLLDPIGHLSLYTPTTLPRFFTKAGFKVLKVASSGVRSPETGNAVINRLRKAYQSTLTRLTLKGDRIMVLAQKPE